MCTERKKRNEPTCVCRKKATQNTYYKWTERSKQASKEDEEEEEESDVDE